MTLGEEESEQRRRFEESLRQTDVSIEELWLRYFSLGGQTGQFEVEAYVHGAMALPALQRDLLAHALNERLDEIFSQLPRAPYSQAVPDQEQPGGQDRNGIRDEAEDEAEDDKDNDDGGPGPDGGDRNS